MSNTIQELINSNEKANFEKVESSSPNKNVVIVTCMDVRINPYEVLGLKTGNAHILRNAGGVLTQDIIRSIVLSQQAFKTDHIVLIQHTDCGLCQMDETEMINNLENDFGQRPEWEIGSFTDPDDSIRSSIEKLKSNPFVQNKDQIFGFIYDVDSGKITQV